MLETNDLNFEIELYSSIYLVSVYSYISTQVRTRQHQQQVGARVLRARQSHLVIDGGRVVQQRGV